MRLSSEIMVDVSLFRIGFIIIVIKYNLYELNLFSVFFIPEREKKKKKKWFNLPTSVRNFYL